MRDEHRTYGGAPAMPSGDGKPLKALTCSCADCDFRGGLLDSVKHYQATRHDVIYKGYVQDFSHVQTLT